MICAAIDIGSNTTRILVAEQVEGQLVKLMEQRSYTRIAVSRGRKGKIPKEKVEEVAEVVETQVRLAREVGAEQFRAVATAAIREAPNSKKIAARIAERAGIEVEVISEMEEGRLAFLGATKSLGHLTEGTVAVVDVGGGSTEISFGTAEGGVGEVKSWPVGSGMLADELIESDPPSPSEIRRIRDRIEDDLSGKLPGPVDQAVAVGGSATSLRRMVGTVLEYETLERGIRVLTGEPVSEVARLYELDPVRVRILPTGILILERVSELLGMPLQIGKGGIREGMILDQLNGLPAEFEPVVSG
jgi:exopolyphosphatase/guanosine-5'-triphosphate,3'-diphosphate pyrophosphatase